MRCGHLFNGIGGFQLAAAWMGWENIMSCEIDEFCNKVTKQHFPNCTQHGDIKTTDFSIYRGKIDIITGGFPCQPFSVAGDQTGEEHEQYLLQEMFRASFEIMPGWIVAENVPGITSRKFKQIFALIYSSLEDKGYTVQTYNIPASAVEAPHERQRIWFVANRANARIKSLRQERENTIHGSESFANTNRSGSNSGNERAGRQKRSDADRRRERSDLANPDKINGNATGYDSGEASQHKETEIFRGIDSYAHGDGLQGGGNGGELRGERSRREQRFEGMGGFPGTDWKNFPTKSPLCGRNDGISNRMERIKALGNAIVPEVAFQIFKTIDRYEQRITEADAVAY